MFLFNFNNGDPNRPSFFEMFAQFQMMPSFKPALKYIFTVLSQRHSVFQYIVRYYDEWFYSMLLLLEYHYLKYYEGSFSENFYNLKRVKSEEKSGTTINIISKFINPGAYSSQEEATMSKSQRLKQYIMNMKRKKQAMQPGAAANNSISQRDRRVSLLFLVFIPYIKSKLDEYYRRVSDPIYSLGVVDDDEGDLAVQRDPPAKWKKTAIEVFMKVYPYVSGVYEALFFIYQVLYLYEYTNFYTPFLHLQKINLKRLTHQDSEKHNTAISNRRNARIAMASAWPFPSLSIFLVKVLDSILDYSKYILPASVFLFKSLEWWYSENRASPPTLPLIPPPVPPKRAPQGVAIPEDKTLCPLCNKPRQNPTICGSGFVYCYLCIFKYVEEHSRCPITFLPATKESLRRIYETE